MRTPKSLEEWTALLDELSDDDLFEIYEAEKDLSDRISTYGPQTDDELWEWIKFELGIEIPRVAVCDGHHAPFDFVADVFFERVDAVLVLGSRGGGKTFLVAVLHWCNSRFKSGIESCTFGAIEEQSFRAYEHLKGWIYDDQGERRPEIVSSMMRETIFKNGSKVFVLGSTPNAVNGPHPNVVHADEVELMRADTYRESRNMSAAGKTADGSLIKPLDVLTSTRKGPSGRMQTLIDEIDEAVREGYKPPRKLYQFCIKESAAERPNCRCAPPDTREARLNELGLDPSSLCSCETIRKGQWDNGKPRTLDQICAGDFFRSRGHLAAEEVEKQFRENDRDTFEVQQLCLKPEMKFHFFGEFNEAHHAIRNYIPDPSNGPIFTSTDWGGTNPSSTHWYQLLQVEVEVDGWTRFTDGSYLRSRLKEGTIVCFDEVYKAEIGNDKFGQLVLERELYWKKLCRETYPQSVPFKTRDRFADPQGKAARLDWRAMGLITSWHTTREFDDHIKTIHSVARDDDLFRVDSRCEHWLREVKHWRRDEQTGSQIDVDNHAMSDWRYAMANIKALRRKFSRMKSLPGAQQGKRRIAAPRVRIVRTQNTEGPVGYRGKNEFDTWKRSLGVPISMGEDMR